ncbi:Rne/Rng family ribonuclease [Tessaracoccus rhinocerotis]|uniref:Ribonuclease E n=2 Tax=Tessaracoccus rhinocerotis TaxID=1689449 RepID=A0A553K6E9_9ACTN|nr:Rne/Rng family ribonuclease [Tessaracoccus rhinocerotis]
MVENENGNTTEAESPQNQPTTRRRRAASRPAGPPPEVAAPFQVPQTTTAAAATVAPTDAPAETPATTQTAPRRRRATRPAGEAAAVETQSEAPAAAKASAGATAPEQPADAADASQPVKKPATRRRRASRDTAAADPIVEMAAETAEAAAAVPEPPKESAPEDPTQPPASENAAEKKPATRRRRATRAAAPAEPVEQASPAQRELEVDPIASALEKAHADVQSEPAVEDKKPATRRRRDTRAAAPAEPVEESAPQEPAADPIAAALDLAAAESKARHTQVEAPEDKQEEREEKPATRRRRSSRAAAPAPEPAAEVEEEDVEEDSIGAALRMAEEAALARKALVSDPFNIAAEDRQGVLDELAGAIAAAEADTDDESDEDEDETDEEDPDEDDSDDESSDDDSDSDDEAGEDGRPSRRRRRRGGRRRRRGGARGDSDDPESGSEESGGSESGTDSETDTSSDDDSDSGERGDTDDSSDGDGTTRRRRRRRRGGRSDSKEGGTSNDEITGIEGSTRMEAKRQRRKENRAAGRRRAPILSEAEFLARREAVDRKLVIRQGDEYTQLAVVEDGILVEHYVDRASATSLIGNVYLGRVQNVLPSMEAAFIDIGRGRNAVIYAGEVDWASFGVSAENRKVEKVFKSGQSVLVQVTKDPVGAKGARLTGHISLPGRYIVYSPGGHLSGISRKLPDAERSRLREILGELISDDESVIVRTAAEGASSEELVRDVNRLKAQWEIIEKKVKQGKAPQALYSEPDLTLRIVRDLFTEDFGKLIVQGNGGPEDQYDAIESYVSHVAPHLAERLEKYTPSDDGKDVFTEFRIDEQIAKALDRKVYLPSGGSLVIDRTEAMTVIDVNTGRFTGSGGNLEATVTSNNLEAAEEIVRQLRLRDLGGIIVIDFIDMVLPSNRDLLLRRLVECLGRDRTRHQVAEVTSLGLVQLTRKRIGTGLAEAFTEECEHCHGSGYVRFDEPVDSQEQADGGDRGGRGRGGRSGRRRGGNGGNGGGSNGGGSNGGSGNGSHSN